MTDRDAFSDIPPPRRVAFYGGSFDPVHRGHIAIAENLVSQFALDRFVFVPAFHAPHKKRSAPTSAYDRYAMLCLSTEEMANVFVSKMEIEMPERPYSVETLSRITSEMPAAEVFFVMGADSWNDITTWHQWETVLTLTNHIVVTRPGYIVDELHVPIDVRSRVVDLRGSNADLTATAGDEAADARIYFTDAVKIDISASGVRQKIRDRDSSWKNEVPTVVANYIEKYQIYS